MKTFSVLFLASSIILFSCKENKQPISLADYHAITDSGIQTGGVKMIPIKTEKGTFKVWTKTLGNNPKIKLLLLHGGPGGTHEAFECFESFMPKEGIEIIEYDQLESFYSDKPNDSSLWTTQHFVEEVEQVRRALNLNKDNFYLLGHSWGGILAMEYALKYQDNIKGLIISNMMASIPEYEKYNAVLRSKMRKTLVDSLMGYEAKGLFKDTTYQRLVLSEYYAQHLCRLPELPEPLSRMFNHLSEGIYVSMQGPSEFKTAGRLLHWDRSKDLPKIKVPSLMIGGEFDTMDPNYMKWMATQVEKGNYLYCPTGSHCDMWDDQSHYFPGLINFIKNVDSGKF